MQRKATEPMGYRKPEVRTLEARAIVEAIGPVSAGSGQACGPMLSNFCL